MKQADKVYDIIGAGIGPFNLGLAALLDQTPELEALFFDENPEFQWHAGMLIDGTTLQVPFLADLTTMADPKSPFTFLQYLQEQGRLYAFYFYEKFHIPRQEYNHYCRWAASKLPSCLFGRRVTNVTFASAKGVYVIEVENAFQQTTEYYYSRHIAAGIGTRPELPPAAASLDSSGCCHSAEFLFEKQEMTEKSSLTVIGSGQSAAEIFLHLLQEKPQHGYRLQWYTRSPGFFPMEYSKLGLEHFSPEYTRYFYHLDPAVKDQLLTQQDLLYKGISMDTIAAIYDELYEQTIGGSPCDVRLQAQTELTEVIQRRDGAYELSLCDVHTGETHTIDTEGLILATGYKPAIPTFLEGIEHGLERDEKGRLLIDEKYRIRQSNRAHHIFVQNGEMHTHGVGAPDLGLGAHRNAVIVNELAGRTVYPVRETNVFQQFGWPVSSKERKEELI
ncbi:lysine N(6)-hydroxylase/L-ornithine N(5)-oxygenase family protein [Salibacterium aidingense]|uniref:lysine N(6)-hydroxylase/L-ornithine N(5)-oxygenase family protein n=1 Tax=Salibacterium aidingense TaxID=384933 RepID=UPI00040B4F4D|nr:lysine N(6)-hydroxylase/L-ornithine N(5)-oxygenase family protein [Salibacterium aidingense]